MPPAPNPEPASARLVGVYDLGPAPGAAPALSAGAKTLFGFSSADEPSVEELLARVHPEDRAGAEALLARAPSAAAGEPIECRVERADGTLVWVEARAEPVADPTGGAARRVGVVIDVTERKHAEATIRQQAGLLDAVQQSVIATDLEGRIVYWNRFAERLYGWSAAEVLGRPVKEVTPSEASVDQAEELIAALSRGQSWQGEFPVRRKDGASFVAFVTDSPVFESGRQVGIVSVAMDVTERVRTADALRDSEARFRATFENAAVGMAHVSPDGRYLRVNDAMCALTGLSAADLVGKGYGEITDPDDARAQRALARRLLEGEIETFTLEKRYLRKDGRPWWAKLTVSLVRRDDGSPDYFVTIVEDINDAKLAVQRLRENEAFMARFFDALSVFVGVMDTDGTLRRINRAPLSAGGLSEADVLGRALWDCPWWSWSPEVQADLRDAVARATRGEVVRFDVPLRLAGDARSWMDFQIAPLEDQHGAVTHLVPSGIDISSRHEAELALRESEQRFRAMADDLPLLVWVTDAQGRLEFVNRTFCDYFSVSPGEAANDLWRRLAHPADSDGYFAEFAASVEARRPFQAQMRVRRSGGEQRWIESWGRPRFDPAGRFLGVVGTSVDITDRKAMEAAQEAAARGEQSARRRAELLSMVMAELEALDGVQARARRLVHLLVPALADEAVVEAPGEDPPELAAAPSERRGEAHAVLSARLHVGGRVSGVLRVGLTDPARPPFDDDDRRLLDDIAERAGLLLGNARLFEQEHHTALALQRTLLPDHLVEHPMLSVGACYEAVAASLEVGGDWYDTIELPSGDIALTVGDVVGHGLVAAGAMGRLRNAIAAIAPRVDGPAEVLCELDEFIRANRVTEFATACCAILDPGSGLLRYASAGHPPMLLVAADGAVRWLEGGRSRALCGHSPSHRPEAVAEVAPGELIVLFSDGLIERRRRRLSAGLAQLAAAAARRRAEPVGQLCGNLVVDLLDDARLEDDVVVVCARLEPAATARFHRTIAARPEHLARLRRSLRAWLTARGLADQDVHHTLLAVGEAVTNAIEHAYRDRAPGQVEIDLTVAEAGELVLSVSDRGQWQAAETPDPRRGRGTPLMAAVSESFDRRSGRAGTTVVCRLARAGGRS
ncbi:MAG: PAS domain S-box protein [Acidimicrobiales bacterium]